jgi:small subunit ribosomal protein S3
MGHKIRPDSFRLGVIGTWKSRWFAKKSFKDQLEEDVVLRALIHKKISAAGIVRIDIERAANGNYRITIKAARPGFIIGRGGKGIEMLHKDLENALKKIFRAREVVKPSFSISLNIEELKRFEISAPNVAHMIAQDLEKRLPSRRTIKKHLEAMMQNKEVLGAKIHLSGRIDGAEIAHRQWLAKGRLPLTTLRANIDYGEATAFTSYGTVGIKVMAYKGDIFEEK